MEPQEKNLPIGYWLQKGSNLLTEKIVQTHQSVNLSRTDWQIIHSIKAKDKILLSELVQTLAVFADIIEVQESLARFYSANIIVYVDEAKQLVCLTPAGDLLHQECLTRQKQIRQKAMAGISESEYQLVIKTLQKLVANLEEL